MSDSTTKNSNDSKTDNAHRCIVTGQPIERTGKRGRPSEYASAEAREFQSRINRAEQLLAEIAAQGMTDEAVRQMRAKLFSMSNIVNNAQRID